MKTRPFKHKLIQGLRWLSIAFLIVWTVLLRADAALDLEVTQGVQGAVPIAVLPFKDEPVGEDPATVIRSDLTYSGRFQILNHDLPRHTPHPGSQIQWAQWKKLNQTNLVLGEVEQLNHGKVKVHFQLWDVYGQKQLLDRFYVGPKSQIRRLAHKVSDAIYEQLTGKKGIFSTSIAYSLIQRHPGSQSHYRLMIADYDGHNAREILSSEEPIMSPAWSPDGKRIAYVSFETGKPAIYVQDIDTGERQKVAAFPGINGAPAWSPDGKKLALVLSKTGSPDIFILDFEAFQLKQVTDDWSIDTEPQWTPDGKKLIFTSNRGGSPQLYELTLETGRIQRLTFDGAYNASPTLSPYGDKLAFIHRQEGTYRIAVTDLKHDQITLLTQDQDAQTPSMAPNGEMVVYGTHYGARGVLGIASVDGKIKLRLPAPEGSVETPAWSPLTQ